MNKALSASTLLLAYHGATDDTGPAETGKSLASKLEALDVFGDVQAGFYKHPPFMNDLLKDSKGDRIYILPMLMSCGFFAQQVFPRFLHITEDNLRTFPNVQQTREKTIIYTEPLGALPGMFDLVLQIVEDTLNAAPPEKPLSLTEINIALIGHGTPRHSQSKETTQDLAEQLNQAPNCGASRAFFIEEAPFVHELPDWTTESDHCVVVPFMAADGPHAIQDIPIALGQTEQQVKENMAKGEPTWSHPVLKNGKHIWITPPIGLSPLLPDLIVRYLKKLV